MEKNLLSEAIIRPPKTGWKKKFAHIPWYYRVGIIFMGLGLFLASTGYFYVIFTLPKLTNVTDYTPSLVTEIYAQDLRKIAEYSYEKRFLIPYEEIPKTTVNAFIAAEDSNFFEHKGIDYLGIIRAMVKNLMAGRIVQGGSTITQQVAKSLLLTRERSFRRKIKEAFLAKRIEENLSKKDILYLYLNQIYLGHGSYGIQAAAENYFKKDARDLTLAESAFLAGLPQAPSRYSPFRSPEEAKNRQVYTLSRMFKEGYITEFEMLSAKNTPLKIYYRKDLSVNLTPHFSEHVRRYIEEKYGKEMLYSGGLQVFTTMDLDKQLSAQRAVQIGLEELEKRQGYQKTLGHIDLKNSEEVQQFLYQAHQEAADPEFLILPSHEELQDHNKLVEQEIDETPLKEGKKFKALVMDFDRNGNYMMVQVGTIPGLMHIEDIKWVRKPDVEERFDENRYYLKDPRDLFKKGDILLVSLKTPTAEEYKSKKYDSENIYFNLEQEPDVQGALLSLDSQNGFVVAMVGGYDFTKNQFNRAIQGLRQPGSAFKPIIYAAALDKGYTASSIITDSPIVYETGSEEEEQEEAFKWRPKNYGGKFHGDTTFRQGLVKSMNVITIKITQEIGVNFVTAFARKLGIEAPINRDLSLALGSSSLTLMELTKAYSVFAREGKPFKPIFITKILDREGNVLERHTDQDYDVSQEESVSFLKQKIQATIANVKSMAKVSLGNAQDSLEQNNPDEPPAPLEIAEEEKNKDEEVYLSEAEAAKKAAEEKQIPEATEVNGEIIQLTKREREILYENIPPGHVITPQTAYLMTYLLNDVVKHGTGRRVLSLGRPAAGKTGTTNDEFDAWFMGFIPDMVTGVWVGYDDNRPLGSGETGSRSASPIWLYYMKWANQGKPVRDFVPPNKIVFTTVDRDTGALATPRTPREQRIQGAYLEGTEPTTSREGTKTAIPEEEFFLIDSHTEELQP